MSDKIPTRVLEMIASEPWLITDAGMAQIQAIAERSVDVEAVEAKLGKPLENTRTVTERDGVALIPVTGPIFRYANLFTRISGATSVQDLATDLQAAIDNPAVKSIVLNMDSPGGMVSGISDFAAMVHKSPKPVVAFCGGTAVASAAFWIAAAAKERVASPTTLLGSVGAALDAKTPPKPREGAGRDVSFVSKISPKKRIDLETDEGQAQVATWVDDIGEVFVADVAKYLGISTEDVLAKFGQGDLMIASKAKEAGMVDRIGTLEEVIADLSSKTKKGTQLSPRIAAINSNLPTASAKEKRMDEKEIPDAQSMAAQLEAYKKKDEETQAQLQAIAGQLNAEAEKRIAAEVEQFKGPLVAQGAVNALNVGSVNTMGNMLLVAKAAAAGLPKVMITEVKAGSKEETKREISIDAKALGEFIASQVEALGKAGAKFVPPTQDLGAPAAPANAHGITVADLKAAATNPVIGAKVMAAVKERQKTNPKFTRNDLRREILAGAN